MARSGVIVFLFCYFRISMMKYIKNDLLEECMIYGTCANVQDYPTELARKLIAELKAKNTIFNVDEPPEETTFTLESRFSLDEDMKRSLCNTIRKSWRPKYARHESGKIEKILNDDVQTFQRYNIGICPDSSGPRDDISKFCQTETMLMGYKGQCIQKSRLKEMYYIDGNRTATGYFYIPTCCSCDYIPI